MLLFMNFPASSRHFQEKLSVRDKEWKYLRSGATILKYANLVDYQHKLLWIKDQNANKNSKQQGISILLLLFVCR